MKIGVIIRKELKENLSWADLGKIEHLFTISNKDYWLKHKNGKPMTLSDFAEIFGVNERSAQRTINNAIKAGIMLSANVEGVKWYLFDKKAIEKW